MPSIETITSLQTKLRRLPRGSLVSVEGFMGSGKTSLTTALAEALGGLGIHTDKLIGDKDESKPYVAIFN